MASNNHFLPITCFKIVLINCSLLTLDKLQPYTIELSMMASNRPYAIPHVTKRETDSGQKSGYYTAILSGKEDRGIWRPFFATQNGSVVSEFPSTFRFTFVFLCDDVNCIRSITISFQ